MNISETKRKTLFQQGQNINEHIGTIFATADGRISMAVLDVEFDELDSFQNEIDLYRDQLIKIKEQF